MSLESFSALDFETATWPELAIGLYDKLTGRNAKITYEFENMNVQVPSGTGSNDKADWNLNGKLTISTTEG
ncbi:MAG: hypothetical protein AAFY41_15225 [Bacteroidota bacterium]